MADTRRRALIAALLGAIGATLGIAGVGHAYLRKWRRALAWFVFVLGVSMVLLAVYTDPATVTPEELPMIVVGPVFLLLTLSIVDAYYVAKRDAARPTTRPRRPGPGEANERGRQGTQRTARMQEEPETCPHCGREVDPSLDFCQWCAEPLDDAPEDDGPFWRR